MTSCGARVVHPLKLVLAPDRVLSPSFAAPGGLPAVHEQAMGRLTEVMTAWFARVPADAPGPASFGWPADMGIIPVKRPG